MDFKKFLKILWSQKASGDNGFEGLIRKLLEIITGQRFYLSLSGRQEGRDVSNEMDIGNYVAVECKRYKEKTPLPSDELLTKFIRAKNSEPTPDIWIVVTTRRLGEQQHRDLKKATGEFGISYFDIDAENKEQSLLFALCASAPEIVTSHLAGNLPYIKEPIVTELQSYLSGLATDKNILRSIDYVKNAITNDVIGYEGWKNKQNKWLLNQLSTRQDSIAKLGQDLAVRSPECKLIKRSQSIKALENWWQAWQAGPQNMVILGEEGDGKSWVVADWLADHLMEKTFPPVVFVPSTHVQADNPLNLIIQTIQWQLGKLRDSYWEKRVNKWIDSPQKGPVVLLILDGLNERPGFNWRHLLSFLETSPYINQVAVLMTCRSFFWSERIESDTLSYERINLLPYDENELSKALEIEGLERDTFDDKLLNVLSKPRYFNLTIKLKDNLSGLGDVTIERLIYEDWRDQISRKTGRDDLLSNDDFQELISDLAQKWANKGMLNRKDIYSELSMYGDGKSLIDEMRDGRILLKENNRWQINSKYLILGLGLLLADDVEQTVQQGQTAIDELIAKRLEPQSDMDLKVSICGMAFFHSLVCREDYPDGGRLALFRAWIRGRNIQMDDWQRIPAYLPLCPRVYFKMAEYIWSNAGENREAQNALMSGFLKYSGQGQVLPETVRAFERWMGFVHPDGHHGRHANNEEERQQGREKIQKLLGKNVDLGTFNLYGYPLEFTDEEGWIRLSAVALSVISHQKRKPYTRAFAIHVLAGTLMGYIGYQSAFNWVIRTSPDDIEKNLLSIAEQLMKTNKFVPQRSAWWLLTGLSSEKGVILQNQIPTEYEFKNPMYEQYEKEPCESFFLWDKDIYHDCIKKHHKSPTNMTKQLKAVALDPELEFPKEFISFLNKAGEEVDFKDFRTSLNQNLNGIILRDLEPALCAWCPERIAEIYYYLTSLLAERTKLARRLLSYKIYDHLLLMTDEQMDTIKDVWHATLESEEDEDKLTETTLFPCVLWGKELTDQLKLIELRGFRGNYLGGRKPFINKLKKDDLPLVTSYLKKFFENHRNHVVYLLDYIAEASPILNQEISNLLLDIFNQGDTKSRGACLKIFFNAKEPGFIKNLLEYGWCTNTAEGDQEKYWGSLYFCKYGSKIPFEDLVNRIQIETLGYAIQCRGRQPEEVAIYNSVIHKTWESLFSKEPIQFQAAERVEVEMDWVEKKKYKHKNWKLHSDHKGNLTYRSWDSVWGGGLSETKKTDLKDRFNFDKSLKEHNKMSKKLFDLLKSETKSGNPWFLSSLKPILVEDILDIHPHYIEQWIKIALNGSTDSNFMVARCRSFYEALCEVLLTGMPELGVKLFKHLLSIQDFRLKDSVTQIDSLLFCLFSAKDSEPVLRLRHELVDNCSSDKELFELVFLSQYFKNQEWLLDKIDILINSKRHYDIARGITILGMMDGKRPKERLQEWIDNHRASWARDCAKQALHMHQTNMWAKKWFEKFLTHEDDLNAWAAFRLLRRCIDRRFWLWAPNKISNAKKSNRVDYYNANIFDLQKKALKNEKETLKLEKKFLFSDIQENQTWPWMKQYL